MIAQATLDGFFGLFSMPEVFGFWRNLFVKRPVRPDLLIPVVHVEDHPHPDYWRGSVYPIKRGDDAERTDDMRYAYVPFSDGKYKFDEATYFKAEGVPADPENGMFSYMQTSIARQFDTKRLLEQEDKAWLMETLERQRQKPKRKREPEP